MLLVLWSVGVDTVAVCDEAIILVVTAVVAVASTVAAVEVVNVLALAVAVVTKEEFNKSVSSSLAISTVAGILGTSNMKELMACNDI